MNVVVLTEKKSITRIKTTHFPISVIYPQVGNQWSKICLRHVRWWLDRGHVCFRHVLDKVVIDGV